MKTSSIVAATAALMVASASAAYGIALNGTWSGTVMGMGESPIRGTATMKAGANANTTDITISYTGDASTTPRPWHIHMGSCGKDGGILGDKSAYTPVSSNDRGVVEGKATVAIAIPDSGSYFVNVHESEAAMNTIIACGDLTHTK